MENFVTYLENLKNSIPVNCSLFNLQRLKIHWLEFKDFLTSLPEQLVELKNNFLQRLDILRSKIEAIEMRFPSTKAAKYAFQEARMELREELDAAIAQIMERRL